MIFKDREDAGKQLAEKLLQDKELLKENIIVVSLLRGGVVVGKIIAKKIKVKHIILAATKIPAPHNPELAIGAVCFETIYLQKKLIEQLHLQKGDIDAQIKITQNKHNEYIQKFGLEKTQYKKELKNKTVIVVDDGVATGATAQAALLFVKSQKAKKLILAVPVSSTDFDTKGFDKAFILHRDPFFSSVSQFYESFPQVEET